MTNSSTCCSSQAKTDLAIFGALVAAPTLLGLNRSLRLITTAVAVGKLATSMLSNYQQSRQHHEFSQPRTRQQQRRNEPAPAPQPPPHRTPAKGGLDHIEGAASGPLGGSAGIAPVR